MKNRTAFLALSAVLFGVALNCGRHGEEDMLRMVVVNDVVGVGTLFLNEYPDASVWTWDSSPQLSALAAFVSEMVVYGPDPGGVWQYPREVLASGVGDCEDFAFLYCSLLRFLAYNGDLFLVEGKSPNGKKHIWCEVWPFGLEGWGHILDVTQVWPVDCTTQTRSDLGYVADYIAVVPPVAGAHVP